MYRTGAFLALAVWLAAGCSFFERSSENDIQNVIVLSVDTLTTDFLRPYTPAAEALPHFDKFAEDAVLFRDAFTSATWTLPAHASLLTGLYPDRHGVVRPGKRLGEAQATLASLLREKGFETVAFTGGGFLSGSFGFSKDFDRYDGWTAAPRWRPQLRLHEAGSDDGQLFDRAIAYLNDVSREKRRFFLFLHTYFVHDYYKIEENEELKECVLGQKPCGQEIWNDLRSRYRDRLVGFDKAFGRLLATIEKTGLRGSTLVILLSDHGEGFDPERGRIHHGGRLHGDVVRIPLLVGGAQLSPRIVDDTVSIVDVAPTLQELLSPETSGDYDGVSFVADLLGNPKSGSDLSSENVLRDGARLSLGGWRTGRFSSARGWPAVICRHPSGPLLHLSR